jgi:DNA topoisomerase-1
MFNQANTSVALLCNHQKTINSSLDNMLKKIDDKLKELKQKKKKYQDNKNKDKTSKIENKIKTLKLKKETKLKMKNVSLGTSKNNYIDPRIIFAFIKKFEIPPEKLFTKVLIKRFEWASNVDSNFKF